MPYHLFDVQFRDAENGWIVGRFGKLLHTTNSGEIRVDEESGSLRALKSIQFVTDETGYIAGSGGTLLKTMDGGKSWTTTEIADAVNFKSLSFLNDSLGMIAGEAGAVYRTTDGGASWSPLDIGIETDIYNVLMLSDSSAWVLGYNTLTELWGEYRDEPLALKTIDGGQSWAPLVVDPLPILNSISAASLDTMWCVGQNGAILKTTDGGKSVLQQTAYFTPYVFQIDFLDDAHGWLAGAKWVARTTDGGETWTKVRTRSQDWFLDLFFVDENVGFVSGTGGAVFKTIDGGKSWHEKKTGVFSDLYSICFLTPRVGWAVGTGGVIIKSVDYGETWQALPRITGNDLTSIVVNENGNGFIAGVDGTLLRTREGLTIVEFDKEKGAPSAIELFQNYPNPFNASTVLSFELVRAAEIRLELYDIRGRFLKTLYSGFKEAGAHSMTLNMEHLPTGVYISQLFAANEVRTRMLVLQK